MAGKKIRTMISLADTASCYCSIVIAALILLTTIKETYPLDDAPPNLKSSLLLDHRPPCDEIYVVREGETLHTISDKCGDPFIVEQNPHIQDPDDVFPETGGESSLTFLEKAIFVRTDLPAMGLVWLLGSHIHPDRDKSRASEGGPKIERADSSASTNGPGELKGRGEWQNGRKEEQIRQQKRGISQA
ncbi:hypothetical protein Ancab_008898 [Ancistrocladus abbreviatus]